MLAGAVVIRFVPGLILVVVSGVFIIITSLFWVMRIILEDL
jgi:hypothetical protein